MKLIIDKLQVEGLVDLGSRLDAQDPAMKISLGKRTFATQRQKDAGTKASFEEVFEIGDLSEADLQLPIEVEVVNINTFKMEKTLGRGKLVLKTAMPEFNLHTLFVVELTHNDKKGQDVPGGKASMRGFIEKEIEKSVEKQAEGPPEEKLKVGPPKEEPSVDTSVANATNSAIKDEAVPTAAADKAVLFTPPLSSSSEVPTEVGAKSKFECGTLRITQVSCRNLMNVEMMWRDKNDPYVELSFGGKSEKTAHMDGAGDTALFDGLDYRFDIDSKDVIVLEKLELCVKDKNTTADKEIGRCSIDLGSLIYQVGQIVEFNAELFNSEKKGKKAGDVLVVCQLVEQSKIKRVVDPDFKKGVLSVDRMVLQGTDNKWPYIKATFGAESQLRTPKVDRTKAVTPAMFEHLGFEIEGVTLATLQDTLFNAELWNDDWGADSKLSSGSCSLLATAYENEIGKQQEIKLDLTKKSGESLGYIMIYATLNHEQEKVPLILPTSFETGILSVKWIRASNLKNTEIGGQQDPFVEFDKGFKWSRMRTNHLDNIGADAIWENVDFRCPLTKDEVMHGKMNFKVLDHNVLRKNVLIGEGELELKYVSKTLSEMHQVTFKIYDEKQSNIVNGALTLGCILEETKPVADLGVSPDFERGYVLIDSVVGHSLISGNMISAPSPSFAITYMDSNFRTNNGSGTDPVWRQLGFRFEDATPETLTNKSLKIEYFEGTKLIGTGNIDNLLLVGSEVAVEKEVVVDLVPAKPGAKPVGTASLFITVCKPDAVIVVDVAKELELPQFERGVLLITSIKATEIKNTELVGKSDPYVLVSLNDFFEETSVLDNAGESVIWPNLKMRADIAPQDLLEGELELRVMDKNKFTKNTLVGVAKLPLKKVAYSFGKREVELVADLRDSKSRFVGKIFVTVEGREKLNPAKPAFPPEFKAGLLHVTKICTYDLLNKELFGKQDPYAKLRFGETQNMETPTIDNGGSNVTFDCLDLKAPATIEQMMTEQLEVEVWEDNNTGDILIGSGKTNVRNILSLNNEVQISLQLRTKGGDPAGKVLVWAQLIECPKPEVKEVKIADDFTKGNAFIRKISAFKLTNPSVLGGLGKFISVAKMDPYVFVSFRPNAAAPSNTETDWSSETVVNKDAGDNSVWDNLDMSVAVDIDAAKEGVFDVKVLASKTSVIGVGSVPLRRAARTLNKIADLNVDLLDPTNGKPAGRLTLFVEVKQEEPPVDISDVKPDFQFGTFRVTKISAYNLKNTEGLLGGKQDPYVVLSLGQWTDKTHTKDEAGNNALWEFLELGCDVYRESLTSEPLTAVVWDENLGKDTEIGRGSVSILKCGANLDKEVELAMIIYGEDGAPSGKLLLTAKIELPMSDVELPPDFQEGELRIKRLTGVGLQNSGMFDKGDPFLKVSCAFNSSFSVSTTVKDNEGANPTWNDLDYRVTCKPADIKIGELRVECWDKNIGSDSIIGVSMIPLKRAANKIGGEIEIFGPLFDAKGKDSGKIIALVELTPLEAISKPKLDLPDTFQAGTIKIIQIQAKGLTNKELLGKQDPFVQLSIGDWVETTHTLDNAGTNATWKDVDMEAEVTRDTLSDCSFNVVVKDENLSRSDSFLGKGIVSLRRLCARINNEIILEVDLIDEKQAAAGQLLITALLTEAKISDLNDNIPDSAIKLDRGLLVITQVDAFDLKGGDLLTNPDPYVMFNIPSVWQNQLPEKSGGGRTTSWTDINNLEVTVDADTIKLQRVIVEVKDKNVGTDALMGVGNFGLKKMAVSPGEPVVFKVRLKDHRGQPAGRLLISGVIKVIPKTETKVEMDSQTIGKFLISKCVVSNIARSTATMGLGKQDLCVEIFGVSWKTKTDVIKNAGISGTWNFEYENPKIALAQLQREGIKAIVLGNGTKEVGTALFNVQSVTTQLGKWVELKSSLQYENKPVGHILLNACFFPDGSEFNSEQLFREKPIAETSLNNKLEIEKERLRQEELHRERDERDARLRKEQDERDKVQQEQRDQQNREQKRMLARMAEEQAALRKTMESMSEQLKRKEAPTSAAVPEKLRTSTGKAAIPTESFSKKKAEIFDVKLPDDVKQWKNAHVQAWLAFQMKLPQYIGAFQTASIDGLVLIKHVDAETLRNNLNIEDDLHRKKLVLGIDRLLEKQEEQDRLAAIELEKKRKRLAEEEARRKALLVELEAEKLKKEKQAAKKKKKKKKEGPKTYFGEVKEQGVLDRVRVEQALGAERERKRKEKEKAARSSRTWRFEYTGAPQPKEDTIWDEDPMLKTVGSTAYQRTMKYGLQLSDVSAPQMRDIRMVPSHASPEEVLVIIKGAMMDLGEWLVELQERQYVREATLNLDIDSDNVKIGGALDGASDPFFGEPYGGGDTAGNSHSNNRIRSKTCASEVVQSESAAHDDDDLLSIIGDDESLPEYDALLSKTKVITEATSAIDGPEGTSTEDAQLNEDSIGDASVPSYGAALMTNRNLSNTGPVPEIPEFDRMTLVFNALVNQVNNDAKWLGKNDKLTRLKLYGGLESLLRVNVEWGQFDSMWTKLVTSNGNSTGLDLQQFRSFFSCNFIDEKSEIVLLKVLYELCDSLRHAGFTVTEMFSSFDRNASGDISISEFCSMLRLVVGNNFDKRTIYRAILALDSNGDKSVSLKEVSTFVYRIWRTQMDDLAEKLSHLDPSVLGESQQIDKLLRERQAIKNAVKKNFSRQWRDMFERESGGHQVPGPFQQMLGRMNIRDCTSGGHGMTLTKKSTGLTNNVDTHLSTTMSHSPSGGDAGEETFAAQYTERMNSTTLNIPHSPKRSNSGARTKGNSGHNQIMRFKIKVPAGTAPTRSGVTARVPNVYSMNKPNTVSGEVVGSVLRESDQFGFT